MKLYDKCSVDTENDACFVLTFTNVVITLITEWKRERPSCALCLFQSSPILHKKYLLSV